MSASTRKRYRVTLIEWLSHVAVVEATSAEDAQEKALEIRETEEEGDGFEFEDGGVSDVMCEEVKEGA